jgi:hypothetical protein
MALEDRAWDKNGTAQSFAYTTSNVIPATGDWTFETWLYVEQADLNGGNFVGLFSQMANSDGTDNRASLWLYNGGLHYATDGVSYGNILWPGLDPTLAFLLMVSWWRISLPAGQP